jgi:nucleolar complex protein 3
MLSISNDKDQKVVKLGLMSLLAVFKDIIPRYPTVNFYLLLSWISFFPSYLYMSLYVHCSYRIRQLTEKELAVEVSKEVKKTRYYEYTLIRCYKVWISFILFVPSEIKLIIYFSDYELSQMAPFFQVPI